MQILLRGLLIFVGMWPLAVLHGIGFVLGHLLWWVPNNLRRGTVKHLELCLPERSADERRRIARRSLIEAMKGVMESPAIWFGPEWRLRRWCSHPAAVSALQAARAAAPATIFLTPHLGAWELAGQFVARFGRLTILYKPQKSRFDALIREGRSRNPNAHPVPTNAQGVKALLAALKRGETVGILPDHDPPEGAGRFAPLFGIPAHTTDLPGKLAARTGASAWFIVAERLPWARGFRFHLTPAPAALTDREHSTAALNAGVEASIRALPEQYWWSYERFRRRPSKASKRM
ncbi:MAG: hypothetical protein EPN72_02955 [Nevskiaceae bacterium]|nr:MAG: hypothetical protein EPN63_13330 [Nevskiaceae bacterium]TBR74269.1 MAG: hypothetical protein EPN72_02955 [Nevskiaceae bacterium]